MQLGKLVHENEHEKHFIAPEGSANLYYGVIRSGKTYGATADIWQELEAGRTVYATWPIQTFDIDDRENWIYILRNIIFFWKKRFFVIPTTKNFHYINADTGEVDGLPTFNPTTQGYINYLNSLNHCSLYIDEAWRVIDSYQGVHFSVNGRNLILVTGHKFRTVNLIAQRPTSVHVSARGNMNRFYKFEKLITLFGVPRFRRSEFQEMIGETVDESKEPVSIKTYWGSRKIFNSYNSYYYGELHPVHKKHFSAYDLKYHEKFIALYFVLHRAFFFFIFKVYFLIKKNSFGKRK